MNNKDIAKTIINRMEISWQKGWRDKPKTLEEQIAQAIFTDISDRRGLRWIKL